MDEKVKEQILAIRDTGLTNMFDVNTVQRLAYERDFYELVVYLEDHVRQQLIRQSARTGAPPSVPVRNGKQ